MTIVVDSSVIVAMVLDDENYHEQAYNLILAKTEQGETLAAPSLIRSEIAAVLRKAVVQGRIDHNEGVVLLRRALNVQYSLVDDDALFFEAFNVARNFGFARTYDSQYVALARRLDTDFWTSDYKLVVSTRQQFPKIRWLGDLT